MAYIIAIAHICEFQPAQISKALPQREKVGIGLAWMKPVGERVNYGNTGELSQLVQFALLEYSGHDAVHPAREVSGYIGDGLALAQSCNGLV